jgi:hypothetical protein
MKKLYILFIVLLVLGSACKKDFLSVDETNPNNASTVPASFVLPSALNYTAILMNTQSTGTGFAFVNQWWGLWSISGGYSQDPVMTGYNISNSFLSGTTQGTWSSAYVNLLNYDYIEKGSTTSTLKSYRAIAKIMKAYVFQTLVDTYGNIPYSEALKTDKGILKPKYDDQQVIYTDLVAQLDSAMNIIETTPATAEAIGSKDIIYGGDMSKWALFANTLKLRILVNQSGMSSQASYISGEIAKTASVGYIGAGQGAWVNPGYLQSSGKMSPFWESFYNSTGSTTNNYVYYMAGQDACDFLTANNDPRKLRFFQPLTAGGTTVQGNYFGQLVLQTVPNTSKLGFGLLKGFNQNSPILSDIEALFLEAEAAQKGLIPGSAKAFYEAAVTQSVIYVGAKSSLDPSTYVPLSAANATAYLSQALPLVSFDAAIDKVKIIITQKWLALDGLAPMTIWTDWRRTGFPDFLHFTQDINKKNPTPPIRLFYPQTEVNTNNDNVLLQGITTTNDLFTKNIFWDVNGK